PVGDQPDAVATAWRGGSVSRKGGPAGVSRRSVRRHDDRQCRTAPAQREAPRLGTGVRPGTPRHVAAAASRRGGRGGVPTLASLESDGGGGPVSLPGRVAPQGG